MEKTQRQTKKIPNKTHTNRRKNPKVPPNTKNLTQNNQKKKPPQNSASLTYFQVSLDAKSVEF